MGADWAPSDEDNQVHLNDPISDGAKVLFVALYHRCVSRLSLCALPALWLLVANANFFGPELIVEVIKSVVLERKCKRWHNINQKIYFPWSLQWLTH